MLVNAVAIPALSIQPEFRSCCMTVVTLAVLAVTVTFAVAVWANDFEAPVTVRLNVEGITEGPRLRANEEFPVGVTEAGKSDSETPLGGADKLTATGELNPPSEVTVTRGEADPPTAIVIGDMAAKEKSFTASEKFWVALGAVPFEAVITIG